MSKTPKTAPWDRRLAEGLARESWEAANNPPGVPRNPPLRDQIRSPYFWLGMLAAVTALCLFDFVKHGWASALAAVLYLCALIAGQMARGRARSRGSRPIAQREEP